MAWAQPAKEPVQPLSKSAQRDLQLLLAIAREKNLDMIRRSTAVQSLLDRHWQRATDALVSDLAPGGEATTQQAIAIALADMADPPPPAFYRPLLDLLTRAPQAMLPDVAHALGRYQGVLQINRLDGIATSTTTKEPVRRGAVLALGYVRNKNAVATLMKLTDSSQPAALRDAAFTSLQNLTGITEFKTDQQRWERWWKRQQGVADEEWVARLIEHFARSNRQLNTDRGQMVKRLEESQRKIYRATPKEQQAAVLVAFLSDDLEAVRLLGLELARESLVGGAKFDDNLRQTVRSLLDDQSPQIRERSALLLREPELADDNAADAVARRLLAGDEHRPSVLRAYLLMLAERPRAVAIKPAIALLADADLQSEAAKLLAAASAVKPSLLDDTLIADTLWQVRQHTTEKKSVPPTFIALLGRIGEDGDWKRIEGWLDDKDDAIKGAAARAWADSDRSLHVLAQRSGDTIVQPIVIAAAERRGTQAETLTSLIENKPKIAQAVEAWQRALIAMSGRVEPLAVANANRRLVELKESPDLREKVLSAAITAVKPDKTPAKNIPAYTSLLLARAESRLAKAEPQAALGDYQRLTTEVKVLPQDARTQIEFGLMRVRLALGDTDVAVTHARNLLTIKGLSTEESMELKKQIGDVFIATTKRSLSAAQLDRAKKLVAGLQGLLNGGLDAQLKKQIDGLLAKIAAAEKKAGEKPPAKVNGN